MTGLNYVPTVAFSAHAADEVISYGRLDGNLLESQVFGITDDSDLSIHPGMSLQLLQSDVLERLFVGAFEDDAGGAVGLQGFLPAQGAEAPFVARLEAGELEFRMGRDKIVALFH